ncbi:MAG: dienelactone hydrolase family protein [Roseibacillus sp.]|nr:dienelactone hydrolase family protein [Roseibacillus sp.]
MKFLNCLCSIVLLSLIPNAAGGQVGKNSGDVRGSLRLEVIAIPGEIADDFVGLNPQVILYRPLKVGQEKVPLLIFLHGSGGSRRSIERSRWTPDVRRFTSSKGAKPSVNILVPQSNGPWDPKSLNAMLDHVLQKNTTIDTHRIYCVGYSMGGKGTWEWAMASPERFAAIIPKAFIPDLSGIKGMVQLPIWAMVGTKDSRPRVQGIQGMEKALKELGSTVVKTTIFDGANHGSTPGEIRKLEGVYEWLFSQTLPR